MNKSIVAWVVIGLGLGCWAKPVQGETVLKRVGVSLEVVEHFGLIPAESDADQGLLLSASSNHGTEWSIRMAADPVVSTTDGSVLPADDFQYTLTVDPSVQSSVLKPARPVPEEMKTIYTADPSRYSTASTDFGMGFKVSLPDGKKAGKYSTTIHLCMADTF